MPGERVFTGSAPRTSWELFTREAPFGSLDRNADAVDYATTGIANVVANGVRAITNIGTTIVGGIEGQQYSLRRYTMLGDNALAVGHNVLQTLREGHVLSAVSGLVFDSIDAVRNEAVHLLAPGNEKYVLWAE